MSNNNYSNRQSSQPKTLIEIINENLSIISIIGKIIILGYFLITMLLGIMNMAQERGGLDLNAILIAVPKLIALGLMYSGWKGLFDYKKKLAKQREKCTQTVLAVLVDYKKVVHHNEDGGDSESYYAIYNYTYNDVSYRTTSDLQYVFPLNNRQIETGFECKLLVNPNNPMEIYEVEQEYLRVKRDRILSIVCFCVFTFFAYYVNKSMLGIV